MIAAGMIAAGSDSEEPRSSRWAGIVLSLLLFAVAIAKSRGFINVSVEHLLTILLVLGGLGWAMRGPERLRRLSELYLWIAFILSLNYLHVLAHGLAGWLGEDGMDVFRVVAVVHLVVVVVALGVLRAWSPAEVEGDVVPYPARYAAGLLVVGAVNFWVGARTFPGTTLEQIEANLAGHLWTSANFLVATLITLAGLTLLTLALRAAGDRFLATLGWLAFTFGAVFWVLHLAFRLTVMVSAAEEFRQTSVIPLWYQPFEDFSGALFAIYSVLAFVGTAMYGGALLGVSWLPRWVGWSWIVFGCVAAPFVGPPFFIHLMPWLTGVLLIRQKAVAAT